MKIRHLARTFIAGTIFTIPALATAGQWDLNDTEVGYTYDASHAATTKTRAQVQDELSRAQQDRRSWNYAYLNVAKPVWFQPKSAVTRNQVSTDAAEMTAAERKRLEAIYTPG